MTKRFQSFQFVTSHAPFLGNRIQSFYRRVPSQFRSSFSSFPSQLLSFALFDPYSSFFDRNLLPVGVNQTQGSSNDQHLLAYQQCEKIGLFLKVLDNKISIKKSPNDWQLFQAIFKKPHYYVKTTLSSFWATHCLSATTQRSLQSGHILQQRCQCTTFAP